jgi:transglutaminase-like putative cysteine protease
MVETHPKHPGLEVILDAVEDIPTDGPILDSLMFTDLVVDSTKLREFCAGVDISAPLGGVVQQVVDLVSLQITYIAEVTTVATTSDEVLNHQSGVCQDFAHLALAVLRAIGVPARYVSGYFHVAEPTRPSESHAWIEFYSPTYGWCGYDPTHSCLPDERHVVIAHGRDYNDAAPNRGVYVGNATETLKVEVKTTETEPTSPLDLRDDIGRIELPVYAEFPQITKAVKPADQMVAQQQQ